MRPGSKPADQVPNKLGLVVIEAIAKLEFEDGLRTVESIPNPPGRGLVLDWVWLS